MCILGRAYILFMNQHKHLSSRISFLTFVSSNILLQKARQHRFIILFCFTIVCLSILIEQQKIKAFSKNSDQLYADLIDHGISLGHLQVFLCWFITHSYVHELEILINHTSNILDLH